MRFAVLLIALVLAAPCAQAYEASVVYNGCNREQQQKLGAALTHADIKLTELLHKFDRGELGDYIAAWFGTNEPRKIRDRYQRIRNMLDRPRTLVLACEERNCDHDLFGYAQGNSISVCPDFFASDRNSGYDSQAGTLIHEFSHSYADTDDHAYGTGDARILAHEHPEQALSNADSYQYLFEAVTGTDVPYRTARWTPDNACEWAYDEECDHPGNGTGSCRSGTDTADCGNSTEVEGAASVRKPTFGPRNPKDICETALNGTCDANCALGTDHTDCLTGTGTRKFSPQ